MKITADYLRQLINEETQGEMEFAELEAARQNYKENPRDDEARHQFGMMVEKLVEPLMIDMGLFFEAEAFYNRGELVFTNYKTIDVTIDPLGMMGRYDVQVTPLPGAEDEIEPIDISLDTMKGVAQFVNDKVFRSSGMVGEPEAQTELPLENKNLREAGRLDIELYLKDAADGMASHGMSSRTIEMGLVELFMDKIDGPQAPIADYEPLIRDIAMDASGGPRMENKMRVTKSQLQQVIREAIREEVGDRISGKDMLAMYDAEQGLDEMSAEEAMEELDNILTDIRQTSTDARSAKQAYRAEDMLRVITRG
jgi:hypothetical protein